jgi:hypothetical protein
MSKDQKMEKSEFAAACEGMIGWFDGRAPGCRACRNCWASAEQDPGEWPQVGEFGSCRHCGGRMMGNGSCRDCGGLD